MTWQQVSQQLGVGPGVFYWRDAFRVDLGGPYSGIFITFHDYPGGDWAWDNVYLADQQIVDMVNLRFTSEYWHRPYYEVARYRLAGGGYYRIGYGYSHRFGAPYLVHHHDHAWGRGFADHYHRAVASGHHHAFIRPAAGHGQFQGNGNGPGNHGGFDNQHQGPGQHQAQGQHQTFGHGGQNLGTNGQRLGNNSQHSGNNGHGGAKPKGKPATQQHHASPSSGGNNGDKKNKDHP
jgi:hypothetical protein